MTPLRFSLFLALVAGQAAAFMVSNQGSKALGPLLSYNRNYDPIDSNMMPYNDRYSNNMGYRNNGYDSGRYSGSYNDRYSSGRYPDYGDRSYDRYGYGGTSRSKFSDWMNGSSSYLPAGGNSYGRNSYDRNNYVMNDRRYNSYDSGRDGRYSSDRYSSDRYSPDRYSSGSSYGRYPSNSLSDSYSNSRYSNNSNYNSNYNRNYYNQNEYRGPYNPVNYRNTNLNYNYNSGISDRGNPYRSSMDSHRQEYPSYNNRMGMGMGMGGDYMGISKWWEN